MQIKTAQNIAAEWSKSKTTDVCPHETLEKEYHLGSATGDYVCKTCGMSRFGSNWNKKEN